MKLDYSKNEASRKLEVLSIIVNAEKTVEQIAIVKNEEQKELEHTYVCIRDDDNPKMSMKDCFLPKRKKLKVNQIVE